MISNLTETTMCLIEETGDSTHERTGRGSWGLPPPPPPSPSQILGNSDFFGQQEKFWQNQFLQKFPCFVYFVFFFFESDIFLFEA